MKDIQLLKMCFSEGVNLKPVLDEFEEIVDFFAERAFDSGGKITNKHSDKECFQKIGSFRKRLQRLFSSNSS